MAQPNDAAAKRCLTCGYILDHLPAPRCPECGRDFDPTDRTTYAGPDARTAFRWPRALVFLTTSPLAVVPLTWTCLVACGPPPIGFVFTVLGLGVNLARRRWSRAVAIALLNPLAVFFVLTIFDYFSGSGTLWYPYLPRVQSCNVDPVYRCQINGRYAWPQFPVDWLHNATLKTLIAVFGPMRGSYLGPYPTAQQCQVALIGADELDPNVLAADRIVFREQTFRLDNGVGADMLRRWAWRGPADFANVRHEAGPLQVTLWQGCPLLRSPRRPYAPNEPRAFLVVLDPVRGRPFAYYAQGIHRGGPPSPRWLPP